MLSEILNSLVRIAGLIGAGLETTGLHAQSHILNGSGSVGSLIGAALETAGYQTQSQILNTFELTLSSHIGGLLYLLAIIAALITISIGGSYRYGLWLLVGPPLFFFLTQVREPIAEANWQIGDNVHAESKPRIIQGSAEIGDPERRVSVFFKAWNRLTTDIIQELIRLLHLTEKGSDLDFLNKTDLYLGIWNNLTIDPSLKGFVNLALVNKCAPYFYLQREVNSPFVPDSLKPGLRRRLEEHNGKNVQVNMNDQKDWFKDFLVTYLPEENIKDLYTCNELWTLAVKAFRKEAKRNFELMLKSNLSPGLRPEQRLEKFMWKCSQIKINAGAINLITDLINGTDQINEQCLSVLINEIAARALSNEFASTNKNLIGMNLNEHPQLLGRQNFGGLKFNNETSRSVREISGVESYLHRGELIAGALTLPYIQGMCLYFLAFSFPFFALMVIIPGRESAVLTWMSLWLWLRLWDFGFAVVMLIDNILYALLPHGPIMYDEITNDPGKAFAALLETDPTYSAYTYYNLVACCLFAVPVITGLLVTKGGGELVNAVSQGWKEFPQLFGNTVANFQKAMVTQDKMRAVNQRIAEGVRAKAWESLANDSDIKKNLETAAALQVAANTIKGGGDSVRSAMLANGLTPGSFKGISATVMSSTGGIAKTALEELSKKYKSQAMTKLSMNMQMEKYKIGNDYFSRYSLAEAVGNLGYNSHHVSPNFPMESLMKHIHSMEQNNVSGRTADKLINSAFEAISVTGQ